MSLPELSNIQIEAANKNDSSFGGCFSRDDLPQPLDTKYYIVNLDSKKGSGTHWVLVDNRRSQECIYFDSYGMPPPEEVLARMQNTGKKLVYNDADVQELGSEQCGWWCEYVAEELGKGKSFKKVVSFVQNQPNPDKYLEKVFHKSRAPYKFNMDVFLKNQQTFGTGIFDIIKNRIHFQPRKWPTKRFENFLNENGPKTIVSIKLGKQPIQSATKTVLNWMSLGKFEKMKKQLKYQDVYHNFLVVRLEDGAQWIIERKHVVLARPYKQSMNDPNMVWIPIPCNLTLSELIEKASKDDSNFWKYDPEKCNCQTFVRDIVCKNVSVSKDVEEEIRPQDSRQLLGTLPKGINKIPKLVTDVASVGDRIIFGDGI